MLFAALNAQALSSQVDSDWLSTFHSSSGRNQSESESHMFYLCHCCYSSHRVRTIIKTLLIIIVIVYCTCLKARFTLIWLYGAVIIVMLLLVIRMSAIISVCLIWDSRKNPDHLTVGKFGLHNSRLLLYFERPPSSHLTCVNNKCTCFKSPLKMRKAKLFV